MGVLLRGKSGDFILNNQGWVMLLRLAWDYGWRPRGTVSPRHWLTNELRERATNWNPADYVTCRGQTVTALDAQLFADALAAVLDDLPHDDPLPSEDLIRVEAPGFPAITYLSDSRTIHPFEQFGGVNKSGFHEFIHFCRQGGFSIW
ncbi:MAG: hypothetical protein KF866_03310 [Phycisphaeraceae bacterium]|nr:hypothetical protein [Phycisphaeraceae bacterium]MCW5753275.1 hypothetical protein [Phycisphaeraceae bacterium]